MKKKILIICLVAIIAVTAIAGASLAYLTDTDEATNVMTLGNVDIEQLEYQRATDANGEFSTNTYDGVTSYVLKEFEQDKPILPVTWAAPAWDDIPVRMSQVDSYGGMSVFDNVNAVDKFVTVENTGKTDAYIRTLVAIECGSLSADKFDELVGHSYHTTWNRTDIGIVAINGNNYYLFEFVYAGGQLSDGSWRHENGVLPAGETSYPNLSQVYLAPETTNGDCVAIDGNANGKLDILVFSQAVQAAGFDSAQIALDAAFGDITTSNHPWAK